MHDFLPPLTDSERLIEERHAACELLPQKAIRWFTEQQVPAAVLANPDVLVHAKVKFAGTRFIFHDEAAHYDKFQDALIIMLRDGDGRPYDLAAWARRPSRLGTWCGRAAVLGDPVAPRLHKHGALLVHPDPLGWLRHSRAGVVIIHRRTAARELMDLGPLAAMGGKAHVGELFALFGAMVPPIVDGSLPEAG
ncbi:hypothetical protein ABEG18_22100 [Alsobacter sp. KACC 23698]|uniref:Uncharacterized protein n=1 Tax=Alsobacter sp. KACC 23698 TaxID=3149229 RepID=A0AAU7JDB3_9HYPH